MKSVKLISTVITALCLLVPGTGICEFEVPAWKDYRVSLVNFDKYKKPFDDPTPILKKFGVKQILPPELYNNLAGDPEEMKKIWEKVVGFKSPDVVGKIRPEIKPGKYTYKDVQGNAAFKELMPDWVYSRVLPGGEGGLAGNIPDFEIVPTKQYYYQTRIAQATLDNMGKTQLDESGYIKTETLTPGYPFPRMSGPHAAQKAMYNIENRYTNYEFNSYFCARIYGLDHKFNIDFDGWWDSQAIKTANRLLLPPYGYLDERAQKRQERRTFTLHFGAPRDIAGFTQGGTYYLAADQPDMLMMYIPAMRRIRKMTATDTQDPMVGMDLIYDDGESWFQKLSPTRYPYKYEVIADREFLIPSPTEDGACYISKKEKFAYKGLQMQRRPMLVLQLTQLDPNYVYSKRVLYVDKELLVHFCLLSYDQKGRLYREFFTNYAFEPNIGMPMWSGALQLMTDVVDTHSTVMQPNIIPARFNRKDVSMRGMLKKGKR